MPFAVVAAGAGIYSSIEGGNAAGQTAASASNARNQSNTIFNEQQGYEKQLSDLFSNPNSLLQTPFYGFEEQQGEQALERQMGAGGYLGSGNLGTALQRYGAGFAGTAFEQYAGLLGGFSGLSQNPMQGQQVAGQNSNMAFNQYGQLAGAAGSFYQQYGGSLFNSGGGPATQNNGGGAYSTMMWG